MNEGSKRKEHDDHVWWSPLRVRRARPSRILAGFTAVGLITLVVFYGVRNDEEPRPLIIVDPMVCPTRPTAALPFDPAYGKQLDAYATDIFIGQVLAGATGPRPASPVPGAPPWVTPVQLEVAVIHTEKGTARGTVVVHQAFQFGIEGCHGAVAGDYPVDQVGDVLRFVTVRDEPTGTYSLIAGPFSHESSAVLPGTVLPLHSPIATAAP